MSSTVESKCARLVVQRDPARRARVLRWNSPPPGVDFGLLPLGGAQDFPTIRESAPVPEQKEPRWGVRVRGGPALGRASLGTTHGPVTGQPVPRTGAHSREGLRKIGGELSSIPAATGSVALARSWRGATQPGSGPGKPELSAQGP